MTTTELRAAAERAAVELVQAMRYARDNNIDFHDSEEEIGFASVIMRQLNSIEPTQPAEPTVSEALKVNATELACNRCRGFGKYGGGWCMVSTCILRKNLLLCTMVIAC